MSRLPRVPDPAAHADVPNAERHHERGAGSIRKCTGPDVFQTVCVNAVCVWPAEL